MPDCGLRDCPLNTRREPKESLRSPATGGRSTKVAGSVALKLFTHSPWRFCSVSTRAASAGERSTCAGGTFRRCSRYFFGTTFTGSEVFAPVASVSWSA